LNIKLPISFEAAVTSSNRITIPTWITYVEGGDEVEGYVQIIGKEITFPFTKKVSNTRHITVGFVRSSLPDKQLPSRLQITIEKVNKVISEGLNFNLVSYKSENGDYLMNFSTAKAEPSIQFRLDTFTVDFVQDYFQRRSEKVNQFLDPFYDEEEKRWIIPIYIPIPDEMGSTIPFVVYLVLSQDYYQKYLDVNEKIRKLILRLSNWAFDISDFNIETLSKLSSQLQEILEKNLEPEYYEMKAILEMATEEREILLITLKEHRSGGISLNLLAEQLQKTKQNVLQTVDKLVKQGILRKQEEDELTIIDILWVV
jgi:DNA replication protein DnaD